MQYRNSMSSSLFDLLRLYRCRSAGIAIPSNPSLGTTVSAVLKMNKHTETDKRIKVLCSWKKCSLFGFLSKI